MLVYEPRKVVHKATHEEVVELLASSLLRASRGLPSDAVDALSAARDATAGPARAVMDAIFENLDRAEELSLPICQDTGMGWFLVRRPHAVHMDSVAVVTRALERATQRGYLRSSVVGHPLNRVNPGTNLPPVVHEESWDGPLEIWFYLRGFGSENAGAAWLMRPTSTAQDIVDAVMARLSEVGGGACPPVFLGIGIGGTLDKAALLAKKALFREVGSRSPLEQDRALEEEIMRAAASLPIGPGGVGEGPTVMWAAVESYPTHIAGLPVVLAVSCWADRRGILVVEEVAP